MVCVSFYVICIVELLVSSVICRFQGLSYSHLPECIEFSFILFIHHNIHFYFELCTYCNILDIYLSWNMNSVKYLFYMELLNYLFCDMFGGILECYWPALRAGLLCCNFFGQPGSVSKFPPLLWVKLWVGWVGRGYTEISRYFPASWINWVTLVTKIKLLYSLRF